MHQVREIQSDELRQKIILEQQAYTAYAAESDEEIDKALKKEKEALKEIEGLHAYGVFEGSQLIGSMSLLDFQMNIFGSYLPVGGLSDVAVDLLHKKRRVAKSLVDYYLEHYDRQGYALTALYAFRPDFYYQMGFGYAAKKDVYTVSPSAFPNFGEKSDLTYVSKDEEQMLLDCYHRYADKHHGVMKKVPFQYKRTFEKFGIKIVGVKKNGQLTGYAIFSFKKREINNSLSNNMTIHEFVYNDKDALQQLSTFFHSQKDQINRITFPTQDPWMHHFFSDPRDGTDEMLPFVYHQTNQSGVGFMYRIINVKRLFTQLSKHNFNNMTHTVTFKVNDTMYPANAGDVTVAFKNGKPTVVNGAKADTEITIDIADLTSLVLGVVGFNKLHLYGKTTVSNEDHVDTIDKLFFAKEQPITLTNF
ncbi:GNAT family N-acetyltransferase [Halalkalibacillus halophilus]|uniref:GNAT family N-acetyltransferase n=1 Tax=Halalkalibacillus halophilus TaxID=392827 RepID=UPI0003FFBB3F|nr:GNAT family N-acetyltransferase [Halalkalibacillus halophilus]